MSKSFNEIQFNQDLSRLMEAQQPSLRLQQAVLEKMRAQQGAGSAVESREKVLPFKSDDQAADSVKTHRFNGWSRLAQVAAVLVLLMAVSLIYPLLKGNWGARSMGTAQETNISGIEETRAAAAPEQATMAESAADSGVMEAKMFEATMGAEDSTLAGDSGMSMAGTGQAAAIMPSVDLTLSFDDCILNLSDFPEAAKRVLTISNSNSEKSYFVGLPLRIEKLDDEGLWKNLDLSEEIAWIAIAYEILPATSDRPSVYTETIDFSQLLDKPQAGQYRVVKDIEGEALFAEFVIMN